MTKRDPHPGEESLRHLVAQAERQLAAYGRELDAAIEDIRAGQSGASRDQIAATAALRKALEAVFSERARLEKLVGSERDGRGDLDLDAAWAEVRRRMARLRAAQPSRGVSE